MENALLKGSKSRTEKDLIDGSIAKFGDVFSFGINGPGFTNWSTEIDVTCHVCAIKRPNSKWHWDHNTPQLHLDKGCITCRYENNFLKKAKTKFPIEFDYSPVVYIDDKTHVNFICVKHGELISQRPKRHLDKDNQGGCKACCLEAQIGLEKHAKNFFENAPKKHNGFYDYSKVNYQGGGIKVVIICPIHEEFPQTPNCHMQGKGCPRCKKSKGELMVHNVLQKRGIMHETEFSFDGSRRRYDFMIFASDEIPKPIIIEYDGKQHFERNDYFHKNKKDFESEKQADIDKTLCAIQNGYTIIRIDHKIKDIEVMEVYLENAILCAYDYDILISSDKYAEHIHNVTNAIGYDISTIIITELI